MKQALLAQAFLDQGIVQFPEQAIRFKSGLLSPVYMDNRCIPFYPTLWKQVIEGLAQLCEGMELDIVAGVELAGIPHGAALAMHLQKPFVFVRKQAKEHGTKKIIEGGSVSNKKVLVVEDMVSTGSSSLGAIESIRKEGGRVQHCLCISSYDMGIARDAFEKNAVQLHSLMPFQNLFQHIQSNLPLSTQRAVESWIEKNK